MVNGKIYVGQTKCTVQKRWNEHISEAKRNCDNYKINNAIRKYGKESFEVSVLEKCIDSNLNERERFWISKLNTFYDGYNTTLGGDGSPQADYDKIRELWDAGFSIQQIANMTGYCSATVQSALHTHITFSSSKAIHRGKSNQMHRVHQYDLNGNFLQTFDSTADAARKYGVDRTLISAVCRHIRPSGAGYQWRYEGDDPPSEFKNEQKIKVPVGMYDFNGNFLISFDSITEAEKQTGISHASISSCCNGRRKTGGGFIWKRIGGEHE